jgi:hypothetical protein
LKALLDDLLTLACFDSQSEVLDYSKLDLREFLAAWRRIGNRRSRARRWRCVEIGTGRIHPGRFAFASTR